MIDDIYKDLRDSIAKAHEAFRRDLSKVRTGRANAAMLDPVRVDYYGSTTPISQMATVSTPEPRLLTVKPWDRSAVKAVEKAIREADLGLNPQTDGDLIRVPIPPLTEERRKEMVKLAKKFSEESKVSVRNARRDALELISDMVKDGDASEDEGDRAKKKVEEIVVEGIKQVDALLSHKEKDVLDVG
jgi:ribosome recycling factor